MDDLNLYPLHPKKIKMERDKQAPKCPVSRPPCKAQLLHVYHQPREGAQDKRQSVSFEFWLCLMSVGFEPLGKVLTYSSAKW